jgi:hypothetical protein
MYLLAEKQNYCSRTFLRNGVNNVFFCKRFCYQGSLLLALFLASHSSLSCSYCKLSVGTCNKEICPGGMESYKRTEYHLKVFE